MLSILLVLLGITLVVLTSIYVGPFLKVAISEPGAGFYGAILAGYPLAFASFRAARRIVARRSDAFDVIATESRAELARQLGDLSIGGEFSISQTFRSEVDGSTRSVEDLADLIAGGDASLALLGAAGEGKSFSATAIAIEVSHRESTIALIVPSSQWDPTQTSSDWAVGYVQRKLSLSRATSLDLIATRKLLLIFDGLDDLAVPDADRSGAETPPVPFGSRTDEGGTRVEHCEAFLSGLIDWRTGSKNVPFLLTCRSEIWGSMDPRLMTAERLTKFALRAPTIDAVKRYLSDVIGRTADASFVDQLIQKIGESDYRRYLKSRWRVAMLGSVARNLVPRAESTAGAVTDLTRVVTSDELLHRFVDLALGGRRTLLDRGLAPHLRDALASFASYGQSPTRYVPPEAASAVTTDLFLHRLWPVYGPWLTRATDLTLCVLLSVPGFVWLFAYFWPRGPVAVAACFVLSAVWSAMLVRTSTKRWVRPAKFDRNSILRPQRLVKQTAAAAAVGFLAGYTVSFWVGVGAFVTAWLAVGFTVGFGQTLTTDSQARVSGPTSTLRYEHWVSRVSAVIVSPLLVVGFYALWDFPGAVVAIGYCAIVGESVASALWRRHIATSIVAVLTLRVPPGPALRRGERFGLIRSAGLAYQFRHDTLRNWFLNEAYQTSRAG